MLLFLIYFSIADMPTPRDRMVQVVRWYLCSFHAGRKSGVAKKPYNPVLGEVFRCHWDLMNEKEQDNLSKPGAKLVKEGPIPWCTENQLSFIAEQVSHHPPGLYDLNSFKVFLLCLFIINYFIKVN